MQTEHIGGACERPESGSTSADAPAHAAYDSLDAKTVLHWYDFLCPFCYVAQSRNALLRARGYRVEELPFQAHPEIPPEGITVGPRSGPMYTHLEREARAAGLELNWPPRLPDTRAALAMAEWVRRHEPQHFHTFQQSLFRAHFVLGEDLGNVETLRGYADSAGVDRTQLDAAMQDGSAYADLDQAEAVGRRFGVSGTPAWLLRGELISGLLPVVEFERLLAKADIALSRTHDSARACPQT